MTIILVVLGLFLILRFWKEIFMLGIIFAFGLFAIFMMSILNVWIGIDIDTVLKAVLIIIAILIVSSVFIGNIFDKILSTVISLFK
ncbi:hypothetical protein K5E_11230 [Enterococcus thailandicus]|uniref:hypothetical protein n=1 Tax=Enterococcus thailandicus TaxID=417368 RepID=UPI00244D8E2A|nr:hypothetical protein [Enterococcus thailandicus]GMC02579.1 hypothetical protein K4E_00890 [Enterococcus thailandicus]GMC08984.1 hypothetical protein K5E_11230 [Enterococcus thailandicus]